MGTVGFERPQDVESRRSDQHIAVFPALDGFRRPDPRSFFQLPRHDYRLEKLSLRPFQQIESGVEPYRRTRRRDPAAGEYQSGGVKSGAKTLGDTGQ